MQNGFCYGFLPGEPLDTAGMSDPHIAPLTAALLGKWHRAHVSGDMAPMLWEIIDKWLSVGMFKCVDAIDKIYYTWRCTAFDALRKLAICFWVSIPWVRFFWTMFIIYYIAPTSFEDPKKDAFYRQHCSLDQIRQEVCCLMSIHLFLVFSMLSVHVFGYAS